MTNLVPFNDAPVGQVAPQNSAFLGGISLSSLKALSTRGKVFRIRIGEEEHPLLDANKRPRTSVTAVLVAARDAVSKKMYQDWQGQGATRLLCASRNGVAPDAGDAIQCASCVMCPNNVFGSSKTGRGKACTDYKRVVLAFYDLDRGTFIEEEGEILTLRMDITAGSFKAFKKVMREIYAKGVQPEQVVINMEIDPLPEYPSLLFSPVGVLPDAEYQRILEVAKMDDVQAEVEVGTAAPVAPTATLAALPSTATTTAAPVYSAPAPAQAPAPTPPPPPPPAPEPAPVQMESTEAVKNVMGALEGWS